MSDLLFEPIRIGALEVKNRILMPAMHLNMCRNYEISDRIVDFYAERAKGGAGLITVGYASVDELSAHPGHIGAHRDEHIPGLTRLASAIREGGARSSVQINHAGRYNHSLLLMGKKPVAPSSVPSRLTGETPRELESEDIQAIIQRFADAAARVKQAGFDAVEILCGTGYLISEFLSPLTNQRSDDYGGSFENRMRFGVEVLSAVRARVGADYPLMVRINGNDLMQGGVGRKEMQVFAQRLEQAGADAFSVNVGWHEALVPQIQTKVPRGVFGYLARGIKEKVSVPVIAGHRINDPETARELIASGMCDLVAMGRALIADPDLPRKAKKGHETEIVHCVACGQGCFDNLFKMKAVECLCNPRAGREAKTLPIQAASARRVLVVGGGAAGMTAAMAAADCGHEVTLAERGCRLGGQLHLAGAPPGREEFVVLARDLETQVRAKNIRILLEVEVDGAFVDAEKPDAVILATGGTPATPPIPGVDLPHVVQAWDVLSGKVRPGRRVAVIGGGAVGIETALSLAEAGMLSGEALKFLLLHGAEKPEDLLELATRGSHQVTVVEMLKDLGTNFGKTTRWGMLQDVKRFGVECRVATRVLAITAEGLRIEREGVEEDIPADTLVLAVGTRSNSELRQQLQQRGIACQVVGDAGQVGMVIDAIHQGFEAGRTIL